MVVARRRPTSPGAASRLVVGARCGLTSEKLNDLGGRSNGRDRRTTGGGYRMTQVMKGVRVLEVAQFIFAPSAGALLADWGADVIKVEHPVHADGQRGFIRWSGVIFDPDRNPLIEGANRGKRSVGLDISTPEGREVLYDLARSSDVFLTNYLPSVRAKLGIDLAQIRAANPKIIYVRASAYGDKGPDRDRSGFDGTALIFQSSGKLDEVIRVLLTVSAVPRP
jgi:crotonobetainyl-CoA:carnitine CoA-transferase CaiB-like acyl-CoA transferase